MARNFIPGNAGMGTSSSVSRNPYATDSDSASVDVDGDLLGTFDENVEILARLIKDSQLYQQAYNIFSSDKSYGVAFLQQLEIIPYSTTSVDVNFWDSVSDAFGGTSKYENQITDIFNTAMDEIRALVQNYYTFKNSLPVEQVQQLAEAGINAAVTGQGVTPSSIPSDGVVQPNQSSSSYTNEQLSQGVTSFVEFIGSIASLVSTGVNAESLLGMLDIAERESWNKQELHDAMLYELGITQDSPYRVLDNTGVLSDKSVIAQSDAKVSRAVSESEVRALEGHHAVNMGDNPDSLASYEIMTGYDVLNEVSKFKLLNEVADKYITNLRNVQTQLYAGAVGRLEGEYNVSNYNALMSEAGFKDDFFSSRNGMLEGKSETSVAQSIADIRNSEAQIKAFETWLADYKFNIMSDWGDQIHKKPSLAPFFYKALFDFGMSDTFYHQSALTQGLHYGMDFLDQAGSFISALVGIRKPKRRRTSETWTTGSKGDSHSFTEIVDD